MQLKKLNSKETYMKTKTLTVDCEKCKLMHVNDNGDFTCSWGAKGKPKRMMHHKGKTPINCKLKR